MDADDPSSSSSQPDATTTSSQPSASQTTRRTIVDYFATSSSIPRQISPLEVSFTNEDPQTNDAPEPPPKKFKITADNGHDIVIRQPGRKKVKKEESFESVVDEKAGNISQSRRRGKLRMLPSFPLDVVFEVFSHLLPIDLLHLVRATRELRTLLLHRSATYVWKRALANVPDLPQCPTDVSLPRWTGLIFDTFCQNCLASNVKSVNFNLRVRYCNKCVKIKLLPDSSFDVKKNPKDNLILRGVPFSRWNDRVEMYCTIAEKEKFLEEYKAHRHDATTFMKERIEKLNLRAEHAQKCKAWYEAILDRRGAELDEIREKRAEFITEKLTAAGFAEELNFLELFAKGICAIRPWPRIVEFDDHPLVKVPKPLTDKAWDRIKADMIYYMKQTTLHVEKDKRARLEQRRRLAFHTAWVNWRCQPKMLGAFPPDMLMPGPVDLLADSDIKRQIQKPGDEEYDHQRALALMQGEDMFFRLSKFILYFRQNQITDLFREADRMSSGEHRFSRSNLWPQLRGPRNFFLDDGPSYTTIEDAMKSAVFVFRCASPMHYDYIDQRQEEEGNKHQEAECMWYPDFFFHPCTSMEDTPWTESTTGDNKHLSLHKQFPHCQRRAWAVDTLKFDDKASRTVKNLLEAGGLDPTTTVAKLDELNRRFVCLKCTFGARCDGQRKVRVWSWREAVQHSLKTHFGDSRVTWECLYPEDQGKALALQAAEHIKRGYPPPDACSMWKCMRCRDTSSESRRMTMADLRVHFQRKPNHGSVDEIDKGENILYYKARDYTPKELAPVRMVPEPHEPMKFKPPVRNPWGRTMSGLYSDSESDS